MKNKIKWLKKPAHLALTLLVIAILGIGTTIAFFTDIEAAVNSIFIGKIETDINEEISGLTKTNIGVTSTGSSECYVRVRVDIPTVTYEYEDSEGKKTGMAQVTCADKDKTIISAVDWAELATTAAVITKSGGESDSAEWVKKDDGFWYLSVTLNQNDSAKIINKITYPGLWKDGESGTGSVVDPLPDGLTFEMLTIPITSEAVQVEGLDIEDTVTGIEAAYKAFQIVNGNGQKE